MKNPWHRRAICWRRVDTLDRASECPACIPPAGPATGKPLAPPGPLGMRVPRLHSYYGSLRLPILVLLGSCWSPSCTTSVLACSLLAGAETLPPQARRIRVRLLRCRLLWWKVSGLPGSWTAPMSTCPALRPRRDGACPAYTACPYCLPQRQQRRLPLAGFIVAQSHGLLTHCLRFTRSVTEQGARLASGWLPTSTGWGSHPLGCTT